MAAHDNLGDQFKRGLEKEAEGMEPEERSFVQGALRNVRTEPVTTPGAPPGGMRIVSKGKGPTGPIDAIDADNIERSRSAFTRLSEWGFPIKPETAVYPRGVTLDVGPKHLGVITPSHAGWHVSLSHNDRFKEDPTSPSGYKYPEDWGKHEATLPVDEQDLPNALMDHLTNPKVRKAAALDE